MSENEKFIRKEQKIQTNISISKDIKRRAKKFNINISKVAEEALRILVEEFEKNGRNYLIENQKIVKKEQKEKTSITLSKDIKKRAKVFDINVSKVAEDALRSLVEEFEKNENSN